MYCSFGSSFSDPRFTPWSDKWCPIHEILISIRSVEKSGSPHLCFTPSGDPDLDSLRGKVDQGPDEQKPNKATLHFSFSDPRFPPWSDKWSVALFGFCLSGPWSTFWIRDPLPDPLPDPKNGGVPCLVPLYRVLIHFSDQGSTFESGSGIHCSVRSWVRDPRDSQKTTQDDKGTNCKREGSFAKGRALWKKSPEKVGLIFKQDLGIAVVNKGKTLLHRSSQQNPRESLGLFWEWALFSQGSISKAPSRLQTSPLFWSSIFVEHHAYTCIMKSSFARV